jgi:heat-inducible transcriptional repressor
MKKNEARIAQVLKHLVDEYLRAGEPVSSKTLCDKYLSHVSPATLRIDMAKLDQRNLVIQPHTSAGRQPTVPGFRLYLQAIARELAQARYQRTDFIRELIARNFRDPSLALHYAMQVLARETNQLSFVAEPEVANGVLSKLDVFKIAGGKLLFVVSLDSGLDKTMILNCEYDLSDQQLRALVRYVNEQLGGLRIHDILHQHIDELTGRARAEHQLLDRFLSELHQVLQEISAYFIHFDANVRFLEQPEFDSKENVLSFLALMQRQDYLIRLMQNSRGEEPWRAVMGEDFGEPRLERFVILFSRYRIFDVPGYIGILAPLRTDYREHIPVIRDIANTITEATRRGAVSVRYEKA